MEGERWKGGKEVNAVMQVMEGREGRREGGKERERVKKETEGIKIKGEEK